MLSTLSEVPTPSFTKRMLFVLFKKWLNSVSYLHTCSWKKYFKSHKSSSSLVCLRTLGIKINVFFCKKFQEELKIFLCKFTLLRWDEVVWSNNVLSKFIFFFRILFFRIFLILYVLSNKTSFEIINFRKNVNRSNGLNYI